MKAKANKPAVRKLKRVYVTVWVPRDYSTDPNERADQAIRDAAEKLRTYVIPANWRIIWDRGDKVRVCRESRA